MLRSDQATTAEPARRLQLSRCLNCASPEMASRTHCARCVAGGPFTDAERAAFAGEALTLDRGVAASRGELPASLPESDRRQDMRDDAAQEQATESRGFR